MSQPEKKAAPAGLQEGIKKGAPLKPTETKDSSAPKK